MSIQFLKQSTLEQLYSDIKENLERYKTGDFEDLITQDVCLVSDKLSIEIDKLNLIKGNYKNDVENALLMNEAIVALSPHVARDKRLWSYLTHTHLFRYTRERWPFPDKKYGEDRMIRHVINHYFVKDDRGFERDNAASRLWWVAFMCKRAKNIDLEKALKAVFLVQDPIVQLLGRPTSAISTNTFNSVLEKMVNSLDGDQAFLKDRFSYNHPFLKELSYLGGHNLLDALTIEESREALGLIDKKILSKVKAKPIESEVSDIKEDSDVSQEGSSASTTDKAEEVIFEEKDRLLRDKLVNFDKNVISKKFPNTDIYEKVLSNHLLSCYLAYKPRNHSDFMKLPVAIRLGIAEDERQYIDEICQIIDEHM